MKKILLVVAFGVFALTLSSVSECSSIITARVLNFGTYGNGNVFISLDHSLDEPGCSIPYIELPVDGPATKAALATAAFAVATNAIVQIKTDACLNGVPSFSGARPAWIQLYSN